MIVLQVSLDMQTQKRWWGGVVHDPKLRCFFFPPYTFSHKSGARSAAPTHFNTV